LRDFYSRTWSAKRTYGETLGLVDVLVKSPMAVKTETLGLTDYLAKSPSKTMAETLALIDYFSRRLTLYRVYAETLGLKDYISKFLSLHPLTESLGLKDWKALTLNPLQIYKLADKLRKLIDIKGA